MESNQRYYLRRASEERTAALRSITPEARAWHAKLADQFAQRAAVSDQIARPMVFPATANALSA